MDTPDTPDTPYIFDAEVSLMESRIYLTCNELSAFLIEKNKSYGNSAANPIGIFAKGLTPMEQIHVRIDDKLSRLKRGSEYVGDDTLKDLTGYLILLMIMRGIAIENESRHERK